MASEHICDIGSRLELFVDRYIIERLEGVRLQLQQPQFADKAVAFDSPWEGKFSGCITVLCDGERYLMYYRGMPRVEKPVFDCTCLALSKNGIDWEKPVLGLHEYNGSRDNNIVMRGEDKSSHNFCPFLDRRPGVPQSERFKAIGGTHPEGIFAYSSPDGIHLKRIQEAPIVTSKPFAFDSQNVAFWSEQEQCYVLYYRTWRRLRADDKGLGYRWVSRRTSKDFLNWSDAVEMDAGDAPVEQIYTQQTHPYFRALHIYISLAARFWPGRQVVTDENAAQIGVHPNYFRACSDGVLMTSRGGNRYDRTFLESFLRPGGGLNNWVSRANYPALGIVPTGDRKMSLYANRHYAAPTAHAARFNLRTDGFVSANAPFAGGYLLTKPLRFAGNELIINYSTSAAGGIFVAIQDYTGKPLPGYTLSEADEIIGDEIERSVTWDGRSNVGDLAGKVVQLKFVMKDADLYSFRFR